MANHNELLVSARDAEELAMLLDVRRMGGREAEAANALADALVEARLVPHDRLPDDRVAMNCVVVYREEPHGAHRTVSVVHPARADVALGRVSVLSPVGRCLLGQKRGTVASIDVPGGRALAIRVLEIERGAAKEPGPDR